VPDVREWGANHGALDHLVGGGDGFSCHFRVDGVSQTVWC
jgi:hypothetical protein